MGTIFLGNTHLSCFWTSSGVLGLFMQRYTEHCAKEKRWEASNSRSTSALCRSLRTFVMISSHWDLMFPWRGKACERFSVSSVPPSSSCFYVSVDSSSLIFPFVFRVGVPHDFGCVQFFAHFKLCEEKSYTKRLNAEICLSPIRFKIFFKGLQRLLETNTNKSFKFAHEAVQRSANLGPDFFGNELPGLFFTATFVCFGPNLKRLSRSQTFKDLVSHDSRDSQVSNLTMS